MQTYSSLISFPHKGFWKIEGLGGWWWWVLLMYINNWSKSVKETEPDSSQWCPGQESINTNWNIGCSLWSQTFFFGFFYCEGHGTLEQVVQRVYGLHTWRYSKTVWKWSRSVSDGPALRKRVWLNERKRFLPSSSNLWFCDLPFVSSPNHWGRKFWTLGFHLVLQPVIQGT